ncbi:MAG TPA: EamA family transporter [Acidimicrobiales bacterium]|nr:EamA family transporter [Acidimicrobiales bacterium]
MTTTRSATRARLPGVALAGLTAVISGVSVFVNGYGVHAFRQAAVYTTAKNLVAAVVLLGVAAAVTGPKVRAGTVASPGHDAVPPPRGVRRWLGLAYVGGVGGGVAFVLFFDGLAATRAVPAAFLHDTLVVWVALLAVAVLRERISWWNGAAVGLLLGGQAALGGGIGRLVANRGDVLVLAATLLWSLEVVVAKRLLTGMTPGAVGLVRMGAGAGVLLAYLAVTHRLGQLLALNGTQLRWALATGVLLAGYVATWMAALARARAIDVTSVLVVSAVITSALNALAGRGSLAPQAVGLTLVAFGGAAAVAGWRRTWAPA